MFELLKFIWTPLTLLVEISTMFWGISRIRYANGYGDVALTALFVSIVRGAIASVATILTALFFTGTGLTLLFGIFELLKRGISDSRLIVPVAIPLVSNYLIIFGTLASCYWYFVRRPENSQ